MRTSRFSVHYFYNSSVFRSILCETFFVVVVVGLCVLRLGVCADRNVPWFVPAS